MNKENNHFMQESLAAGGKEDLLAAARRMKSYSDEADKVLTYNVKLGTTEINITEEMGGSLQWSWAQGTGTKYPLAGDVDVTDNGVVIFSEDIKKGQHHYVVSAVNRETILWSFDGRGRHGLSSEVAILGGRVYMLEASGPLQYKWLVSVDLHTGKDRRIHYEEHDFSASVMLVRGENKCLFLMTDNVTTQKLFHVGSKGHVKPLGGDKDTLFFPVGYGSDEKEPCWLARAGTNSPWVAYGKALRRLGMSNAVADHGLDLILLKEGLIVHRSHGQRFIDKGRKRLLSFLGEISENPWANWNGLAADMRLYIPGKTPARARVRDGRLDIDEAAETYGGILKRDFTESADGTRVAWIGCWSANRAPRGLLVIGYGAYGSTTPIGTTRWRPYIEQGFAVGFALVRGGGDDNDAWVEAGRREGKLRGVEDFEACIRGLQRATGVPASRTCVFGRSAGGYLVGTTIARNPDGRLMRCAYVESPYVDVLQTASNVKLPLTAFEYMEFGDPAHKIFDFEMMLRLSPVTALGPRGAPGVFVLSRAGLNDRQVYAYESVKWMDALRGDGGGENKILFLTKGVGHNAHGDLVYIERAEDFLILCKKVLS